MKRKLWMLTLASAASMLGLHVHAGKLHARPPRRRAGKGSDPRRVDRRDGDGGAFGAVRPMHALFAFLESLRPTMRARAIRTPRQAAAWLAWVIAMSLPHAPAKATPGWSWIAPTPTPYTLRHVAQLGGGVAIAVGDSNTLLRTSDGGMTWMPSEVPLVSSEGGFQVVRPATGGKVLAFGGYPVASMHAAEGLVAQTTDAGVTWTLMATFPGLFLLDAAIGTDGSVRVVGIDTTTFEAVYLSTNDSVTWSSRKLGYVGFATSVWMDSSTIFVAGFNGVTGTGTVLDSKDDGESWHETPLGEQVLTRLAFRDARHGVVVGLAGTVFTTNDGGDSWQPMTTGGSLNNHDVAYSPDGSIRIASGDEADTGEWLVSRDDGATWTISGFERDLEGLSFASDGSATIVGYGGMLRTTSDGGATWLDPTTRLSPLALFSVRFTDAELGLAVGEGGTVATTTDAGRHWSTQASGSVSALYGSAFPGRGFAIAVGGDRLANTPAVIGSTDGGRGWVDLASFNFPTAVLESVDCTSTTTCVAVGRCGFIVRTEDAGQTWSEIEPVDCIRGAWLKSVRFRNAMAGLAVGQNTILRTTDGGITWDRVDSPTPQGTWAVAYGDDLHAFIAAGDDVGQGVFLSSEDGGLTWHANKDAFVDLPRDIAFSDARNGAAVGLFGSVFTTEDAGEHWVVADYTVDGPLYGIALLDQRRRLAVGAMLGNATIRVYDDAIYVDGFDR